MCCRKSNSRANSSSIYSGSVNKRPPRYVRDAYLRRHTEYVRVVLDKTPHARQARQRTARLISVQDTELSHTDRQLLVAAIATVKDETVSRTVHGLQRPLLLLDGESKHVVLVVLPVAGRLPEFGIGHIRGDDFLVTSLEVLGL